jgi:hypothetical protein
MLQLFVLLQQELLQLQLQQLPLQQQELQRHHQLVRQLNV